MDYRKDNWSHELECFRKAVNGRIDGYRINIAEHYLVDRLENEAYADRIFTQNDIAVAIFNGTIIEGYSSEQNRARQSRMSGLVAPSRVVLGKDLSGNWVVVVIGLLASTAFQVVTCFPPKSRHLKMIRELEGESR
ncbi:DUF4258 domain-containing protein [Paenibacillus sp. D51F]